MDWEKRLLAALERAKERERERESTMQFVCLCFELFLLSSFNECTKHTTACVIFIPVPWSVKSLAQGRSGPIRVKQDTG